MPTIHSIRVVQELEAAILSGKLKPRERLLEIDLISKFGVSRTVIREALKRLEAKGLVRTAPFRGAAVADLTVEEIEELYFARGAIERIAARRVLEHIRPGELRKLKGLMAEVEGHLRGRTARMIEKDLEFHRAIFESCRNRYLCQIIDFLRTQAHIVGYNSWSLPQRVDESIQEHREILKSIEERDREKLDQLVVRHLTFSKDSYLAQLRGTNPAARPEGKGDGGPGKRKRKSVHSKERE